MHDASGTIEQTLGGLIDALPSVPSSEMDDALSYFGSDRQLTSILPGHVRAWLDQGGPDRTAHREALGELYQAAQELGAVPIGFDPSSVYQHLACPGDQIGITEFLRTYRARDRHA